MQSSKGVYKFIRALDLMIIIHGKIYKNVENIYLRCDNIPITWKNFSQKSQMIEGSNQRDLFFIVVIDIFLI